MYNILNGIYPNRIFRPQTATEILNGTYYVYILTYNNSPIVVGQGRKNRAKLIFDNIDKITQGHYKALLVRIYRLFGDGNFEQFVIQCINKEEAMIIEKNLHERIGGNNTDINQELLTKLFQNINVNSSQWVYLKLALLSSFDGLSDLKKWRRNNIINDQDWTNISQRLKLDYM